MSDIKIIVSKLAIFLCKQGKKYILREPETI